MAPRAHGDMILVDRNPLTAPLDELPATRVLATILAGAIVHDDGSVTL